MRERECVCVIVRVYFLLQFQHSSFELLMTSGKAHGPIPSHEHLFYLFSILIRILLFRSSHKPFLRRQFKKSSFSELDRKSPRSLSLSHLSLFISLLVVHKVKSCIMFVVL